MMVDHIDLQVNLLQALTDTPNISIANQLSDRFDIGQCKADPIRIVLYLTHGPLPEDCLAKKFHLSRIGGFIHILSAKDYAEVCLLMVTPQEIKEYLSCRELTLRKWPAAAALSEMALLGYYVRDELNTHPMEEDSSVAEQLRPSIKQAGMQDILASIRERIYVRHVNGEPTADVTGHYKILAEFLTLTRVEVGAVRERLNLCAKLCTASEPVPPFRFLSRQTGCGFVFVPLMASEIQNRLRLLQNPPQSCA